MESRNLILMLMLACCLKNVSAQEASEENAVKNFPAQISIFYLPLSQSKEPKIAIGTHGRKSVNYSYNLSLNLLAGKTGGVNGLEISGLLGHVEGSVHGIQVAGIANSAGKEMVGLQIGGFANVAGDGTYGLQIGGFANIAGEEMNGLQFGSFANVAGDAMNGLQIGGFANIAGEDMNGLQFGSFANVAGDAMNGLQIGGFANVAGEKMNGIQTVVGANVAKDARGIQIAGGANIAGDVKGMQIAGIFNRGIEKKEPVNNVNGIQIAGISNTTYCMSGLQIGGIYNRNNTLRGVNIGVVSITDSIEKGLSLSLVNIVKKGFYSEWELSFSDYANVALSYKMGMQRFYTVYTAGVAFIEDKLWVGGIGFGNRTQIGNRFDFQPELVFCNYFPTNFKNIQNTFDTRLKLGFVYRINENLGLSFAPSIYVMNAKKADSEYYRATPLGALHTKERDNRQTTIGFGINLGLSYSIINN